MAATELVLVTLAVWELLELWFHGSIFAPLRVRLAESDALPAELLRCKLCLAPWLSLVVVGGLTVLPWLVLKAGWPPWLIPVSWLVVQVLAVARLAGAAGELLHVLSPHD